MFHERFKMWIDSLQITDKQLSDITGVSSSTISNVTKGVTQKPGVDLLEKIASSYNEFTPELLWEIVTERPIPQDNRINDLKKQVESLEKDKERLYTIIDNFFTLK